VALGKHPVLDRPGVIGFCRCFSQRMRIATASACMLRWRITN
jgi:hypothetical protein